ncbi:MAG TPA: PAS domain S-box protein [Bacteriovoracaceae bacterium]|nr:PAS domain S-box protein [Bacteriovoracaceae bacterium]
MGDEGAQAYNMGLFLIAAFYIKIGLMEPELNQPKKFIIRPEMYDNLFENFLDMISVKGFDGYFKKVNRRFCEVLGYSKEELMRISLFELIHPDDKENLKKEIKRLEDGVPTTNFDNRLLAKDQSYKWLEWTCVPIPGENVAFAMARDVTAKRESQEEFLETILDNIPDMIFVKEASELKFVRFNKAGEDLLGYSRLDLVGKNDYDFFSKEKADYFTNEDRKVLAGKIVIEIPEETIETRFKGKRVLHTKKIPIFNSNGHPKYLIGISEDITDKKEAVLSEQKMFQEQVARKELEKSLRDRDEFISITSHELKSPLSALKLQAQMFQHKIKNGIPEAYIPEKIDRLVELTESQVLRMDRLVNDMLDVSRIRSGKLAMTKSEVNLIEVVNEVLHKMHTDFEKHGIKQPVFTYKEGGVLCHCDRMRLEQVLQNLLTNAIRYGSNRPIELSVTSDAVEALIKVKDYGIGISPDHMDMIFNRFERAVPRNEVSGLGLGLFISKQIIEAHGGRIWVESEQGKGSVFNVGLPLSPKLVP